MAIGISRIKSTCNYVWEQMSSWNRISHGFAIASILSLSSILVTAVKALGYPIGTSSNIDNILMGAAIVSGSISLLVHKKQQSVQIQTPRINEWQGVKVMFPKVEKEAQDALFFGKEEWETYFGSVEDVPPLPDNLVEILNQDCPFEPGKKIQDLYGLLLIPQTVNGQPLTLNKFHELIQQPKQGHSTRFHIYFPGTLVEKEYGKIPVGHSHWILIRKVIHESRNMTIEDQKALLEQHGFELPHVLEMVISLCASFVRRGVYPNCDYPETILRCAELVQGRYPVVVGDFSLKGVSVIADFEKKKMSSGVSAALHLKQNANVSLFL